LILQLARRFQSWGCGRGPCGSLPCCATCCEERKTDVVLIDLDFETAHGEVIEIAPAAYRVSHPP
jgi:hypothetical protein